MGAFLMNHDFLNLDDPIVPPRTALIMQLAKELQPLSSKGWWREYRSIVLAALVWLPLCSLQLIVGNTGGVGVMILVAMLASAFASALGVQEARNARRWKLILEILREREGEKR